MADKLKMHLNCFNARGLGEGKKRRSVFSWLKQYHKGITLLQETHSTESSEKCWEREWGNKIEFSHGTCGSRGVAILFPKHLEYTINNRYADQEGRFLLLDITVQEEPMILCNIYAPTKDKQPEQIDFITFVENILQDYKDNNIIIGGDFNAYLNPNLDKCGIKKEGLSVYAQKIIDFNVDFNLIDVWRMNNPDSKTYTWRGMTKNGLVQSRLDYWFISIHMIYDLHSVEIKPGIRSDHSLLKLQLEIAHSQKAGRGFWKFNSSLLKDKTYIEKVHDVINSCKIKYSNINNKSLLWDVVKCEIRSETISYASWKNKQRIKYEKELEIEINNLEKKLSTDNTLYQEYQTTKQEYESLQNERAHGIFIRSRVQFIEENEKATKFFLQKEKSNYKTKYIKTLKTESDLLTDPNKILAEQEKFYKNLYSKPSKDESCIDNCSLFSNRIPTLCEADKISCDLPISVLECGKSLQALKNNKSPGSDGFTTEFYKFFWPNIKHFVHDSFIAAFENGTLSIDQRRGILTLLPKADKDLRLLKNWRPLSLLNTDYKILTKLLATRLQKVLPNIISEDQTGYLKGRYIGENIRTILDLFEYTNPKIDPGIILFLDFEKAFDTISWEFLFDALKAFNFGDVIINWIKVIYNNPLCCVTNNGYSSQFFQISRGIRQGCPISALLFIIVAEIMSINLRNHDGIHGITLNDKEIILSQLADDTTIFLKDSTSIHNVLLLLTYFSKCAGLKLKQSDYCRNILKIEIILG